MALVAMTGWEIQANFADQMSFGMKAYAGSPGAGSPGDPDEAAARIDFTSEAAKAPDDSPFDGGGSASLLLQAAPGNAAGIKQVAFPSNWVGEDKYTDASGNYTGIPEWGIKFHCKFANFDNNGAMTGLAIYDDDIGPPLGLEDGSYGGNLSEQHPPLFKFVTKPKQEGVNDIDFEIYTWGGNDDAPAFVATGETTGGTCIPGKWHEIAFHIRISGGGQENPGKLDIYVDGVLKHSLENAQPDESKSYNLLFPPRNNEGAAQPAQKLGTLSFILGSSGGGSSDNGQLKLNVDNITCWDFRDGQGNQNASNASEDLANLTTKTHVIAGAHAMPSEGGESFGSWQEDVGGTTNFVQKIQGEMTPTVPVNEDSFPIYSDDFVVTESFPDTFTATVFDISHLDTHGNNWNPTIVATKIIAAVKGSNGLKARIKIYAEKEGEAWLDDGTPPKYMQENDFGIISGIWTAGADGTEPFTANIWDGLTIGLNVVQDG